MSRDWFETVAKNALEKGIAQGIEKGIAQGSAEERCRVVKALVQTGLKPDDETMVALSVTKEEYEEAVESIQEVLYKNTFDRGFARGKAKGLAEGIDQGRFEERYRTLRLLIDAGYTLEDTTMKVLKVTKDDYELAVRIMEETKCKSMREWCDRFEEENIDKGIAQSIDGGRTQGRAEERRRTLRTLIQTGLKPDDETMAALGVTREEYEEAAKSLQETE